MYYNKLKELIRNADESTQNIQRIPSSTMFPLNFTVLSGEMTLNG